MAASNPTYPRPAISDDMRLKWRSLIVLNGPFSWVGEKLIDIVYYEGRYLSGSGIPASVDLISRS